MRCYVCESFSISPLCKRCKIEILTPNPEIRTLECGLKVLSFFAYTDIDTLLKTKHTPVGHAMYKILSQALFTPFKKAFSYPRPVSVLPIDDKVKQNYSHTAIMTHYLHSKLLKTAYNHLQAKNSVTYSQQSLAYRKANPRNFSYKKAQHDEVILVDDIVTTGSTLCEAKKKVENGDQEVILAVVFADANR